MQISGQALLLSGTESPELKDEEMVDEIDARRSTSSGSDRVGHSLGRVSHSRRGDVGFKRGLAIVHPGGSDRDFESVA
jgi:hypothetical protein